MQNLDNEIEHYISDVKRQTNTFKRQLLHKLPDMPYLEQRGFEDVEMEIASPEKAFDEEMGKESPIN